MPSRVFFIPAKKEEGNEVLAAKAGRIFLEIGLLNKINDKSFKNNETLLLYLIVYVVLSTCHTSALNY